MGLPRALDEFGPDVCGSLARAFAALARFLRGGIDGQRGDEEQRKKQGRRRGVPLYNHKIGPT